MYTVGVFCVLLADYPLHSGMGENLELYQRSLSVCQDCKFITPFGLNAAAFIFLAQDFKRAVDGHSLQHLQD